MLRTAILAYGVLAIAGAIVLAMAGVGWPVLFYLFLQGVIVIVALLFERGRYQASVTQSGPWQETDERFVDPSTGQLMKVRYNPRTGARDYVPEKLAPPTLPAREGDRPANR